MSGRHLRPQTMVDYVVRQGGGHIGRLREAGVICNFKGQYLLIFREKGALWNPPVQMINKDGVCGDCGRREKNHAGSNSVILHPECGPDCSCRLRRGKSYAAWLDTLNYESCDVPGLRFTKRDSKRE